MASHQSIDPGDPKSNKVHNLAEFIRDISRAESTAQVFDSTARWVRQLVPSERAAVALCDDMQGSLVVVAMEGNRAIPTTTRLPLNRTTVGRCLLFGQMTGTDETQGREETDLRMLYEHGLRSSRCVPLRAETEIAGALCVARSTPNAYTREDEELLTEIASIAATHLAMHKRVDAALQEVSSLEDTNRRSAALGRLGAELTLMTDEEQIADHVSAEICELFNLQRASLALIVPGHTRARIVALSGASEKLGKGKKFELAGTSIQQCMDERRIQQFSDLAPSAHFEHVALLSMGLHSCLNAPLICGPKVIGTLNMARATTGEFNAADCQLAGQLATLIAHALVGVWTQSAMRQAQRESDKLARAKGQFLATVSHELRTPLNGVIGVTELLQNTPLNAEQQELVAALDRSSALLRRLVDDVLSLSKLEAGKVQFEDRVFDPVATLEASLQLIYSSGFEPSVELAAVIDPAMPRSVIGDETRLKQVVVNLLSNAVKFTLAGTIELHATAKATGGDAMELHVTIRDSGTGIEPDRQALIFEPFHQEDSSISRVYGGTGLGLAICRELCQAMGGDISLSSVPGQGSDFTFQIRLRQGPQQTEQRPLSRKTVGIYPSNDLIRRSLEASIRGLGADCLVAEPDSPPPKGVDAWILDEKLGGEGETFLSLLQGQHELPHVISLCADPKGGNREPRFEAATHLRRGFSQSELAQALDPKDRTVSSRTEQAFVQAQRVLLVDDNPVNRLIGGKLLTQLGHDMTLAASGVAALELLNQETFDVVLLDLQMPEVDGFDVFAALEERGAPRPKVVALTADARDETREHCLAIGMEGFLEKPIRIDRLRSMLDSLPGRRDAA